MVEKNKAKVESPESIAVQTAADIHAASPTPENWKAYKAATQVYVTKLMRGGT